MYGYLRQHPQIFMPFVKEPHFFGSDLTHRYGKPSGTEYVRLFDSAATGQRVGEASAWYLYSKTAAQEIATYSPGAQIIVMLRNPVDMMYAQHSQLIFNRQETITDFVEALATEPARREGKSLPATPVRVESLFYRDAAHFAPQLQRYLEVFGRNRIHVIVQEEMQADTRRAYREVLRFLSVDESFEADLSPANENKQVKNPWLQQLIWTPPRPVRSLIPILRRHPLAHQFRAALLQANSRGAKRPSLSEDLRRQLFAEFVEDVGRLETLIGRDLAIWRRSVERPSAA